MTRRILTALVVVLSCALLNAQDPLPARADPNAHFSNIGVAVSGGIPTYYLCIAASVPPLFAGVTVSNPSGTQYSIVGVYSGLSCGPGTYAVIASPLTTVPAGTSYTFLAATGGMSDQTVLPPALRNSGFVSQLGANVDTVAQDCPTLDFTITPDGPVAPQDCHGTGTAGSFANIGNLPPPPPPTNTPPPPTNTPPPPPPTNTPPPPTNTPPPPAPTTPPPPPASTNTPPPPTSTAQNTATPAGTAAGSAAPQPTAQSDAASNGPVVPGADAGGVSIVVVPPAAKPSVPVLRMTALSPLVRPGDAARFRVSYVKDAVVQANMLISGKPAGSVTGVTDAHGQLLLTLWVPKATVLRHGHADVRLVAQAAMGTWHRVATITPVISSRSAVQHVTITASPNALVRARVSLPGRAPLLLYGTADDHGRYVLSFTPAAGAPLHGRVGQVLVWSLRAKIHATTSAGLVVSDMIVSVQPGLFARCVQRPTVDVAYRPNAPITVVALLDDGHRSSFAAHTDATGHATVALSISYANAASTASIKATVADAAPGAGRTEAATIRVAVPQACQAPAIITIGG